jgi:large subunit ribosomal protein L30
MARKLEITLRRSPIGSEESQKRTVRALGLTRLHQVTVKNDTPEIRGMIDKVSHLVEVREINV